MVIAFFIEYISIMLYFACRTLLYWSACSASVNDWHIQILYLKWIENLPRAPCPPLTDTFMVQSQNANVRDRTHCPVKQPQCLYHWATIATEKLTWGKICSMLSQYKVLVYAVCHWRTYSIIFTIFAKINIINIQPCAKSWNVVYLFKYLSVWTVWTTVRKLLKGRIFYILTIYGISIYGNHIIYRVYNQ